MYIYIYIYISVILSISNICRHQIWMKHVSWVNPCQSLFVDFCKLIQIVSTICIYILQQYITSGLQTISRCWHCIVDPVSGIFKNFARLSRPPPQQSWTSWNNVQEKISVDFAVSFQKNIRHVLCELSCFQSSSQSCLSRVFFFVWRMQEKLGKIHQTFPKWEVRFVIA